MRRTAGFVGIAGGSEKGEVVVQYGGKLRSLCAGLLLGAVAVGAGCGASEDGLEPSVGRRPVTDAGADTRGRDTGNNSGRTDGGTRDGGVQAAPDAGATGGLAPDGASVGAVDAGGAAPGTVPATVPAMVAAQALRPGVFVEIFSLAAPLLRLPQIPPGQLPNVAKYEAVVDYPAQGDFGGLTDRFLVRVRGYIVAPTSGAYVFRLTSDDGSRMWLANSSGRNLLIDNDGVHVLQAKQAAVTLEAGTWPFEILMFEDSWWEQLTLEWMTPGSSRFEVVPNVLLRVEPDLPLTTAPGPKQFVY